MSYSHTRLLLFLFLVQMCSGDELPAKEPLTCAAATAADKRDVKLETTPYASPGTIIDFVVTGKGLANARPLLCLKLPNAPKSKINNKTEGSSVNSNETTSRNEISHAAVDYINFDLVKGDDAEVQGSLSVLPSALLGNYRLYLASNSQLLDTGIDFTVRSPITGDYTDCPKDGGPVIGHPELYCSQALLDYDESRQIFGKGIADRYIIAQVTIKNLSEDYEYLLHDIRLGTTEAVVASIDRKLVRGLGEKTEQFSARAIALRVTQAGATLLTGVAGVVGNGNLTDAASLVAGPVSTGFQSVIPDLTQSELNRINDLGFSAGQIVVPKHSALPIVVFLSNFFRGQNKHFNKFDRTDLIALQKGLIVQVSGAHVQELTTATISSITSFPTDSAHFAKDQKDVNVTISGNNTNLITKIHLTSDTQPATVFTYPVQNAQFSVPASDGAKLKPGTYAVSFDTAQGADVKSSVTVKITDSTSVDKLENFPNSVAQFTTDAKVTIIGTGVDSITDVYLSGDHANSVHYPVVSVSFQWLTKINLSRGKTIR